MFQTWMRLTARLTALVFPILILSLPLQAQILIDPPKAVVWELAPSQVAAEEDFELSVLSSRYGCAHEFANKTVVVKDGRIDLSFTSTINPAVLCAAIEKPYGPVFKMPALKEGQYKVYMDLGMTTCQVVGLCPKDVPKESAGILTVSGEGKIAYVINPTEVGADKDFVLKLLSPDFGCNIDYLRTASRVQDGKITLTFLDKPNPLVKCAPQEKMYGPEYKLPGLKAGTYEVWAERLPACVEQGCKILAVSEPVGKLTVKAGDLLRKGWFLKQREVKAGAAFTLNVVNNDYGNCNTGFDHTGLVVQDNALSVSFVIVNYPERVCVMDLRPHGPAFNVAALKPGRYPLFVNVLPACLYTEPRCLVIPPETPAQASDTLIVSQTVALGGAAASGSRAEPKASWQDGALQLMLPEGAQGLWRAEVMTLSGRLLHSSLMIAGSDRRALLTGLGNPDRGILLVRLVSPTRQSHLLRVPVP
jgi:hypothetical protein